MVEYINLCLCDVPPVHGLLKAERVIGHKTNVWAFSGSIVFIT